MSLFLKVIDNLGHLILNNLGFEDLHRVLCIKYISNILEKTKTPNNRYFLKIHWKDQIQAELYLKSDENYQKYLNSYEFYEEIKDFIS
uniref:Uncharacterized protein n=1 Tax=viral metagenome TaxID=1070528 RepID=A0A6C0B465_9ZZZZ|tara:strand:- start:22 stop:285 length:264 start_codon:yes stop_codon:yes gene_type:complete